MILLISYYTVVPATTVVLLLLCCWLYTSKVCRDNRNSRRTRGLLCVFYNTGCGVTDIHAETATERALLVLVYYYYYCCTTVVVEL